ncbi:fimbrial protein [Atlantibacter hermannii]|uniref:fimbrial protein n=1 Tax=Atlantibacter hermannii TaxID=565 RepID=UPI0028A70617|nr:fimbrial protein [Atlantibacter hermannii]
MTSKLTLAVVLAAMSMSASVLAADGTVNFTGTITDKACTVDTGSKNQTVDMGTVATTAFGAKGDTAAAKSFTIKLTTCPTDVTTNGAAVRFDGMAKDGDPSVLALDAASVATDVGIQIKDNANKVVRLFENSSVYTLVQGDNNLNFTARYISTADTVGAGTANSSAQFTIIYQ